MKKVYLCGPITGREAETAWRIAASHALHRAGLMVLDPMRDKEPGLLGNEGLSYDGAGGKALVAYAERDRVDVQACDAVLAHIDTLPTTRPMWGTPWELGWADAWGKLIVVCTPFCSVVEHLFTQAFADAIVADLGDAVEILIDNLAEPAVEPVE